MGKFEDIIAWKRAIQLAIYIYELTGHGLFQKDLRFRDQIRAAAISIASNIAEGDKLKTNKQSIRFFYIAKGSAAEVLTQIVIAHEIGYIEESSYTHVKTECRIISSMLHRLIMARKDKN